MRNPLTKILSGAEHVISGAGSLLGTIFGVPIDFLSGKACNHLCGPTWDVLCYIENFCIPHLLKFFAVSLLAYVVLLLLYLLYKLKVFHCMFKASFKMMWAFLSSILSCWGHGCSLLCGTLCGMLHDVHERRKRYKTDLEMANITSSRSNEEDEADMESVSYHKQHYRHRRRLWAADNKRNILRRSLRAQNHRVHVGTVDSGHVSKRKRIKHDDVRVIRTSSFAKKGPSHKRSKHQHRKLE